MRKRIPLTITSIEYPDQNMYHGWMDIARFLYPVSDKEHVLSEATGNRYEKCKACGIPCIFLGDVIYTNDALAIDLNCNQVIMRNIFK